MSSVIDKALAEIQSLASALLEKVSPGHQLQMLFIILPKELTCFKPEHVEMMSDHYLALKINVKVGGRNNVLSACLNRRLPYVTHNLWCRCY
ncbi:hypothetical protein Tco_1234051 [Tanacetum coccineum]